MGFCFKLQYDYLGSWESSSLNNFYFAGRYTTINLIKQEAHEVDNGLNPQSASNYFLTLSSEMTPPMLSSVAAFPAPVAPRCFFFLVVGAKLLASPST